MDFKEINDGNDDLRRDDDNGRDHDLRRRMRLFLSQENYSYIFLKLLLLVIQDSLQQPRLRFAQTSSLACHPFRRLKLC